MPARIQPHRDFSGRVANFAFASLAGAALAIGLGVALDGGPRSTGRYVAIAGVVIASFAFFVGVGFWIQGTKTKRAIAEMRAGALYGDWHAPPPSSLHVQVGPKLALVGGKVHSYALHLQSITGVTYLEETQELVVHSTVDGGYGSTAVEVRLPGSATSSQTLACARALARHHGLAADVQRA